MDTRKKQNTQHIMDTLNKNLIEAHKVNLLGLEYAQSIKNEEALSNINGYEYLIHLFSVLKEMDGKIKSNYPSIDYLNKEMQRLYIYDYHYSYSDLYTKFLSDFENELKKNNTLNNIEDLNKLAPLLNHIYANPNQGLERSGLVVKNIKDKINIPSVREYKYKTKSGYNYPDEYRLSTPAKIYNNNKAEVSYIFQCWLKSKEPGKTPISHIYINNLPRDRNWIDYLGNREKKQTKALENLESEYKNIAVITLPSDKGLMDKKLIYQHEKKITDSYSRIFEIATGRSNEAIKDFYISDAVKKLLYGETNGSYDKEKEKSVINDLILKSYKTFGFTISDTLSPAEFNAVYFHFIKYELTKFIIDELKPDSFNISSKSSTHRSAVSSAYYNLMLSLENSKGNPDFVMTKEEFHQVLRAASSLGIGREMNQHVLLIWNAVNAYINANINRENNTIPAWLLVWRNDNQPIASITPLSKQEKYISNDREIYAENLVSNAEAITKILNEIIEHYKSSSSISLKIKTNEDSSIPDKKSQIIYACRQANLSVAEGNYYPAYDILINLINSDQYKKSTRFEIGDNYFEKRLTEIRNEIRKAETVNHYQDSNHKDKASLSIINLKHPAPTAVIQELIKIGVISKETEFDDFLKRRHTALNYNAKAENFSPQNSQEVSGSSVYHYFDPTEYTPQVSHVKFSTNLYLRSINGGRDVSNAYDKRVYTSDDPDYRKNPLNLEKCPHFNITVATNQSFTGFGGYFKSGGENHEFYDTPKSASIMHAYAYEFENFTAKDILEKKCLFLITAPDKNLDANKFSKLEVSIDASQKIILDDSRAVTHVYLDNEKYLEFVKANLLKQMRATVHAHQQSDLTNNIQINLTLPGMGYFANLNAEFNIKKSLAPIAALAYKAALEDYFKEEQEHNRIPRITIIRISHNPHSPIEGEAIANAFKMDDKNMSHVGTITVIKTRELVEKLTAPPGVTEVVCVNGDPRTYQGNEPNASSQEPGIYANVINGRNNLSPINKPFILNSHSYQHDDVMNEINFPQHTVERRDEMLRLQQALEEQQFTYDHSELLSDLKFVAHELSNSNETMRKISTLIASYDLDSDADKSPSKLFTSIKNICAETKKKTKIKIPSSSDLIISALANYDNLSNKKINNLDSLLKAQFFVESDNQIKSLNPESFDCMIKLKLARQSTDSKDKLKNESATQVRDHIITRKSESQDVLDVTLNLIRVLRNEGNELIDQLKQFEWTEVQSKNVRANMQLLNQIDIQLKKFKDAHEDLNKDLLHERNLIAEISGKFNKIKNDIAEHKKIEIVHPKKE